jgi:enoyl-CoA hydratase
VIDVEVVDGVVVVRLAHGKVNALDLEILREITAVFRNLDGGDEAVVLTGSGTAFSAGVDLWRIVDGAADYIEAFLAALSETFETVFAFGKPVVAAVNGHAIAGGCVLAACCDFRIMGERGRIGVTELQVGVPFPVAALEILGFAMGPARAHRAILDGVTVESAAAVSHGFADEVVAQDDLVPAALAKAGRMVRAIPADTFRLTKHQLHLDVVERIERRRPADAPAVAGLWKARAADGTVRAYMDRLSGSR